MTGGVVVLGCLEETFDTLIRLNRLGIRPDHVISLQRDEAKRSRVSNYVDLRPAAKALDASFEEVASYALTSPEDTMLFERLAADVVLVIGWQRLVPGSILALVGTAVVGFHGSADILPRGRGRSPINWSIIEGRDRFVLHMFRITPGIDDGDVVGLRVYDINCWDDCRTVYYKTALAQAELIAEHLAALLAGEPGSRQRGQASYYPKRTAANGRIDWTAGSENICRLVRAVTRPYPGAFSEVSGAPVWIWRAQPFSRDFFATAEPGEVCFVASTRCDEFVVRSGDGAVLVREAETGATIEVGMRLT